VENSKALIVLDNKVVATSKIDQAIWLIQQAKSELTTLWNTYGMVTVTDAETKVKAEQGIMAYRKAKASWDAQRKEWGAPLDAAKKAMDGAIREPVRTATAEEERLLAEINSFVAEVERKERERQAAAQRQADEANRLLREKAEAERLAAEKAGKVYVEQGIPEVVVRTEEAKPIPKAEGIGYVRRWLYRVDKLDDVPAAYTKTIIDDDKVTGAIKAATVTKPGELSTCGLSIPGITIYKEDRPRVG